MEVPLRSQLLGLVTEEMKNIIEQVGTGQPSICHRQSAVERH
jgi:hypothetical protein